MSIFEPIPPVLNESEIPSGARCQEASMLSYSAYIPCGAHAVAIIRHNKDNRSFYMCLECAAHNIHNRGGELLFSTEPKLYDYK